MKFCSHRSLRERASFGGVAVEFAFAFPVLLSMLYGIFEFGRAVWTQNTLEYAVQEATRFAIVDETVTSTAIADVAKSRAAGLNISDPPLNLAVTFDPSSGAPDFVTVTASYAYTPAVSLVGFGAMTLTTKSRMAFVK